MTELSPFDLWNKAGFYNPPIDRIKPKFFIIFAYPGPSGFLHVGHLRSYTYPDVLAKFKMLTGHSVWFPAGIHATGNVAINFSEKVRSGAYQSYLEDNKVTKEIVERLKIPEGAVRYFEKNYHDIWKQMGFFIDQDSRMTTIDDGYKEFIRWQFRSLIRKGFVVQRPYISPICPIDGLVAIDAAETDLSEGGTADIQEFTVIKLKLSDGDFEGAFIPIATLRPETIFGITNVWVHPNTKHCLIQIKGKERWIVAAESIPNFSLEYEVKVIQEVSTSDLIRMTVKCPLVNRKVPVVKSAIVNSAIGTGIVMSVPAHAPADWIAYQKILKTDLSIPKPKVIINAGLQGIPAEEACKRQKITRITDRRKIKKATETVYAKEYYKGSMNDECSEYSGLSVQEARRRIEDELINNNLAFKIHAFTQKVVCRCGERVQIRHVENQWFIRYSDEQITSIAKKHVEDMKIIPEAVANSMPDVLEWFQDRPCVRQGKWLGTSFPDPTSASEEWIIEPIADSTIYPAYYIIAKYLNRKVIFAGQLTDKFFDFVFFKKGEINIVTEETGISREICEQIQEDFSYWYPLDLNFGGKEHRTVHFPAFIKMHAMMFPNNKPRGIFVNWWVYQNINAESKISKSKGGAGAIGNIIEEYSADAIRLYYCHIASPHVDVEWNKARVLNYQKRIEKIVNLVRTISQQKTRKQSLVTSLDEWFDFEMKSNFHSIYTAFEKFEIRKACHNCYFVIPQVIQRYQHRGGASTTNLQPLINEWLSYMASVTPFIVERLWHERGNSQTIFNEPYLHRKPENPVEIVACKQEKFIDGVIEDALKIKKIVGRKKTIKSLGIFTDPTTFFTEKISCEDVLLSARHYIESKIQIPVLINPRGNYPPPRRSPKSFNVGFSAKCE